MVKNVVNSCYVNFLCLLLFLFWKLYKYPPGGRVSNMGSILGRGMRSDLDDHYGGQVLLDPLGDVDERLC